MKNFFKDTNGAVVLGVAMILATLVGATTFYKVRSLDNTLSVTGSTKETVKADLVKWGISTNKVVSPEEAVTAYAKISDNTARIKAFLAKNGIAPEEVNISPVFNEDYWGPNSTRQVNIRQIVTVNSKDVDRIKTISENMTALAQEGVAFSPESPQYSVSNLPELRVKLLGKAVVDARARAVEIAKSTGQKVGKLKIASSGVVQVTQPNSNEIADYGQYDTSTVDKDVMVTVRATFLLK